MKKIILALLCLTCFHSSYAQEEIEKKINLYIVSHEIIDNIPISEILEDTLGSFTIDETYSGFPIPGIKYVVFYGYPQKARDGFVPLEIKDNKKLAMVFFLDENNVSLKHYYMVYTKAGYIRNGGDDDCGCCHLHKSDEDKVLKIDCQESCSTIEPTDTFDTLKKIAIEDNQEIKTYSIDFSSKTKNIFTYHCSIRSGDSSNCVFD